MVPFSNTVCVCVPHTGRVANLVRLNVVHDAGNSQRITILKRSTLAEIIRKDDDIKPYVTISASSIVRSLVNCACGAANGSTTSDATAQRPLDRLVRIMRRAHWLQAPLLPLARVAPIQNHLPWQVGRSREALAVHPELDFDIGDTTRGR